MSSLLLLVCLGCNRAPEATLPAELTGTWTTNAPVYKDRYLKLERDYVIVGLGEERNPNAQRIFNLESERTGPTTTYVIHSTDGEGHHKLTLYYDSPAGTIRLKDQQDVLWKKTAATLLP